MCKIIISNKQCRSARELLGWTQDDLCDKAKITRSIIGDFERDAREIRISSMEKIIDAFKEDGIVFFEDKNEIGVKLMKKN